MSANHLTDKSLRSWGFDANPNVDAAAVHTLAKCEWVQKGLPLCLIGDSGTGKSQLLIALGTEAAMAGFKVKYTLATKRVNELVEAADDKQLSKTIARYGRVDELGYMELDPRLCAAILDRLTFGGNIIETGTDCFRLAQTPAQASG